MCVPLWIALPLFAIVSACAPAPQRADLIGSYAMSIATDTLYLDSTGSYRRVFVGAGTPTGFGVDTGRWWLSNNRRLVALSAFPRRWPAHGRYDSVTGAWHQPDTTLRGFVSLQIRSSWTGAVTLDVIPELGWRYRRVP